ncbi:MAG: glycoside hydrolase, partial [Anaerolineae bacterium]|nr:glycoside hydrolase [Anaerolineae bacterium]
TLSSAAEFTINANLRRALLDDEVNLSFIHTLLDEGNALGVHLDSRGLAFQLVGRLSTVARNFREDPTHPELLQQFEVLAELVRDLPFDVDIWLAQNVYYQVQQMHYASQRAAAEQGDEAAADWLAHFEVLGDHLSMARPEQQT